MLGLSVCSARSDQKQRIQITLSTHIFAATALKRTVAQKKTDEFASISNICKFSRSSAFCMNIIDLKTVTFEISRYIVRVPFAEMALFSIDTVARDGRRHFVDFARVRCARFSAGRACVAFLMNRSERL